MVNFGTDMFGRVALTRQRLSGSLPRLPDTSENEQKYMANYSCLQRLASDRYLSGNLIGDFVGGGIEGKLRLLRDE